MPRLTGAQFLADSLHAQGVTHVFFVPAILSHTLAELDRRTPIRRVLTHGEKAAVSMADGYARASGRVGVSFAQSQSRLALGRCQARTQRADRVERRGDCSSSPRVGRAGPDPGA